MLNTEKGSPDAESYVTVEKADSYHASRGMTIWSELTVEEKEQALRRATDFMVARYRLKWEGARMSPAQALDWPRQGVVIEGQALPTDHIPREVERACADLALKAAAGPLVEDATQRVLQETVGPITTRYDPNSPGIVRYLQVDMMLAPFLGGRNNPAVVGLRRS